METRYFRLKQYGLEHLFSLLTIWPLGIYMGSQLCTNICIKKFNFLQKEAKRTQGEKWVRKKSACS